MTDTQTRIAENLDRQFSEMGFATQGVEALRLGANVSLRTLYKYFPSREAMVIGALHHRDAAYADWVGQGSGDGPDHVLHILVRLSDWLGSVSNTGCLFRNALAAYPESDPIRDAVETHKARVRAMFCARLLDVNSNCDAEGLSASLFILHEGLTEGARLIGVKPATDATLHCARALLRSADIQ
ncbi:MAG: TetR/AcrR family transcriptional regulator [Pseudomonadota bacterium]